LVILYWFYKLKPNLVQLYDRSKIFLWLVVSDGFPYTACFEQ